MIQVGFWNVNGLNFEKSIEKDFIQIDILCLNETWDNATDSICNFFKLQNHLVISNRGIKMVKTMLKNLTTNEP